MVRNSSKRKPIYSDLGYKFGALGLAIILWFFSISNSQFEADAKFPVEIRNIREGKALTEKAPRDVTLRFQGSGRTLAKFFLFMPFSNSRLVLDLERVQRSHVFYLDEYLKGNPQRIDIPIPGVRESIKFIEVVSPDSIRIILDDYREKRVPVIPQITIEVTSGYTQVGEMIITPPVVLVKGAAEAVNQITSVLSSRRTYRDVSSPLEINGLGLWHPAPEQVVEIEPVNIDISVNIQMIGERRLEALPVRVKNVPANLNVFVGPSTVSITVTGGVNYLADLDTGAVEIYIDYERQWSPTDLLVEPQVVLDENLLEYRDLVPKQLEIITTKPPQ